MLILISEKDFKKLVSGQVIQKRIPKREISTLDGKVEIALEDVDFSSMAEAVKEAEEDCDQRSGN